MDVKVKGVSEPRPVEDRQPVQASPDVTAKVDKAEGDVVDIAKGPARITAEKVKALLDGSEEVHHFPEPRVFDQNGDGKFDVLDIGLNNPLFSIAEGLKR